MSGREDRTAFLVDSNIFLRTIVRDEKQTWSECAAVLQAIHHNDIEAYIPVLVVSEVQFVLKSFYGFDKASIVRALQGIAALNNLRVVEDLSFSLALSLFEQQNVKFIDCLLASSDNVQQNRAVILSYDRDFDKLGVRRVEPRDLLKKSPKK